MKKSFTILELIIVLLLLSLLYTSFIPKTNTNNIYELKNRLILQLKYLRYKALTDSKYDESDSRWHKERWSFKIFNCNKNKDGVYYAMYSDINNSGVIAADPRSWPHSFADPWQPLALSRFHPDAWSRFRLHA